MARAEVARRKPSETKHRTPRGGALRGDVRADTDSMCCVPAHEELQALPNNQAACGGTLWSRAIHGHCQKAAAGGTVLHCDMGATAVIDVHQYSLAWVLVPPANMGVCQPTLTGQTMALVVPDCTGDNC